MDTGERILRTRVKLGLSLRGLAKRINLSPTTISQWEHSRNQPNGKNLQVLSRALNKSPNWILTGKEDNQSSQHSSNVEAAPFQKGTKRLPILSHVQAGQWSEALDYRVLGLDVEYEDAPITASDQAFWLRVFGDSMTSPIGLSIPEGMLILVDPEEQVINGSLVVAKLDGTDEATFKKFVSDAGMKFLKPLNPTYPTIPINGNCEIVGVVKEAKLKL